MRQSPAASLFLFLIKDSPKDKHVQPADPGSIRHGGQFHRGDQQHAQNDTYGQMACRADKRYFCLSKSFKSAGEGIAGKAQRVKAGNQTQMPITPIFSLSTVGTFTPR